MLRHLSFRSTCKRVSATTLDVCPTFQRQARFCMTTSLAPHPCHGIISSSSSTYLTAATEQLAGLEAL